MLKKVAAIILSLLMASAMFMGCSSSTGTGSTNGSSKTGSQGAASSYPGGKQITLVVQSSPGGLSDQVSRQIASELQKNLGTTVVCVYKPGGNNAVGLSYLSASKPDGYTIGHTPVEISMLKKLGYADLVPDDFTLLCRAYTTVGSLVVAEGDTRFSTAEEFIAYAKAHPGELKVGNAGTGSIWHLGAIGMEKAAGIKLNHVPFDGSSKAVAALMGHHIDAVVCAPTEALSGIDGKRLTMLATMGEKRSDTFKDVPTLKELNVDYSLMQWGGFAAPKGIPDDVKTTLVNALEKSVNSDDFKKLMSDRGMEASFMKGAEYENFVKQQVEFFDSMIDQAGIKK